MSFPVHTLAPQQFPTLLHEIPQPPQTLNYRGLLPDPTLKLLAVVGSRQYSTYGKQVVDHLIDGLSGYNVGIVSGLALGIDSLAHEAALRNHLYTLAIPGSGIPDDVLYPARHRGLAKRILEAGGGLLSEFEVTFTATKWSFAQRNRIMAGIAHATLVIEATEKSGTLITARLTVDYNRELLVVPGNIFSQNTAGPHQFLKLGATPVTHAKDILYTLGIDPDAAPQKASACAPHADRSLFEAVEHLSPAEQAILSTLSEPQETDTLIRCSKLPPHEANAVLMQMEIKGLIASENNLYRRRT